MEKITILKIKSTKGTEVTVTIVRTMEGNNHLYAEDGIEVSDGIAFSHISMVLEGKTYTHVQTGTYKGMLILIDNKDHAAVSISKEDYDKIVALTMEDILNEEKSEEEEKEESDSAMNIPEQERRRLERNYDNLYNEGGDGYNPYRIHE